MFQLSCEVRVRFFQTTILSKWLHLKELEFFPFIFFTGKSKVNTSFPPNLTNSFLVSDYFPLEVYDFDLQLRIFLYFQNKLNG